jgi:hypothetical protein
MHRWVVCVVVVLAGVAGILFVVSCGSSALNGGPDAAAPLDGSNGGDATKPLDDGGPEGCADSAGCSPAQTCTTTLTGVVYDPAGKNPISGAIVYVPESGVPLWPLDAGTSSCGCPSVVNGNYIVGTSTDENGAFTLPDPPVDVPIPLVIQLGKWRRSVTVPSITPCGTMAVAADLTRLPRNQSEGDMPQMAVLTGACDQIACFLDRVGIDPAEFTGPSGGGRVHVYRGAGPGPDLAGGGQGPAGDCTGDAGACPLWSTKAELERYDAVLLGCECGENNQTKPDMTPMHDWLGEGGRIFAVHNQETWLKNGPPDFQGVAQWVSTDAGAPGPFQVDTTNPAGGAFKSWLSGVDALDSTGAVALDPGDVSATIAAINPKTATRWIYEGDAAIAADAAAYVETFSVDTPVVLDGGPAVVPCGRATITDVHVGANGATSTAGVPGSCAAGDLSPEEKALEYLFFGVGTCVSGKVEPPPPRDL